MSDKKASQKTATKPDETKVDDVAVKEASTEVDESTSTELDGDPALSKYERTLKANAHVESVYLDPGGHLFFDSPMLKALKGMRKVKNTYYQN